MQTGVMTELTSSPVAATLTLRVAEARVEDTVTPWRRLAPADLAHMGARAGDVVKIRRTIAGLHASSFRTTDSKA